MASRSVRQMVPADREAVLELELAAYELEPIPGLTRSELAWMVDRQSALGLYRREGFEAAVEWPHWVLPAT